MIIIIIIVAVEQGQEQEGAPQPIQEDHRPDPMRDHNGELRQATERAH